MFKWMYRNYRIEPDDWTNLDGVHSYEFASFNAVLGAYHRGDIKAVDGQVTVWFAGGMVIELIHPRELNEHNLHDKCLNDKRNMAAGRIWVEEVCQHRYPYST